MSETKMPTPPRGPHVPMSSRWSQSCRALAEAMPTLGPEAAEVLDLLLRRTDDDSLIPF